MTFLDFSSHDSTQLITLGTQSARLTDANRSILSSYSSYLWMIDDNLFAGISFIRDGNFYTSFHVKSHLCPAIYLLYSSSESFYNLFESEMDILAMEIINFNLKWWKVRRDFDVAFEWEILNILFFFNAFLIYDTYFLIINRIMYLFHHLIWNINFVYFFILIK